MGSILKVNIEEVKVVLRDSLIHHICTLEFIGQCWSNASYLVLFFFFKIELHYFDFWVDYEKRTQSFKYT